MPKIRVLPVDDSVVARRVVSELLAAAPDIEVQRAAASGEIALQRIESAPPDVVVLDVEMPGMNGIETLAAIRRTHPRLPVLMFSAVTANGSAMAVEALARGASDLLAKPSGFGPGARSVREVGEELVRKVRALGGAVSPAPVARPPRLPSGRPARVDAVLIGSSTGGPNALASVVPLLPADFPVPVVIVQHMPPVFTARLAERLDAAGPLRVREAATGDRVAPGTVLLAPGGAHLVLRRDERGVGAAMDLGPPENSCRPAVDVLFRSAVEIYGAGLLGVILTGMGQDGLRGSREIVAAGGQVLAQDAATSVVWGMPGAVANEGLAAQVLPLNAIAAEVVRRVGAGRRGTLP